MPTYPCDTIEELCTLLSKEDAGYIRHAIESDDSAIRGNETAGNLDTLLCWRMTPKGHEYWQKLHRELRTLYGIKRQDWEPKACPVYIHNKVITLINKALTKCDVPTINNTQHYYQLEESSYPFTHIGYSTTPGRISGMRFNVLQSLAFTDYESSNGDSPDSIYEHYAQQEPSPELRTEKGTFLKTVKLLRALLPDIPQDKLTCVGHELANLLRLQANPDLSQLKISEHPSEVYTLPSEFESCMKNKSKARFQIYDDLKTTSILYITEDNTLMGRALIHKSVLVHGTETTINLMDRIYAADADIEALFILWAQKNYWRKAEQKLGCDDYISPEGEEDTFDVTIECHDLTDEGYEEVPYMDTFCYYSQSKQTLSSHPNQQSTKLQDTDGEDSANIICGVRLQCYDCGCLLEYEDSITANDDNYCEDCYHTLFFRCDSCGDLEPRSDNCHLVTDMYEDEIYVCTHCRDNRFVYCYECEEYFHTSLMNNVDGLNYCDDCKPEIEEEETESETDELWTVAEPDTKTEDSQYADMTTEEIHTRFA